MTIGSVVTAMIDFVQGNPHDVEHLLKVYGYAKAIGEEEGLDAATQRTLEIAAVVHDIGIPLALEKYGSDAGPYQEELGPDAAREMLEKLGCDAPTVARVCTLVGRHHTYEDVDGPDCRILLEADFLVNASFTKYVRESIEAAKASFFRTRTGIRYLDACLLK